MMSVAGVTVPAGADLQGFIDKAVAMWERLTGYAPFYVDPEDDDFEETTRRYDPPGARMNAGYPTHTGGKSLLPLKTGFVSVSEVLLNKSTDYAGDAQTEDEDYFLQPYNALDRGEPYTSIQFSRGIRGKLKSISITGAEGYTTDLSPEFSEAILKLAGSLLLGWMREGQMADVLSWSEGDSAESRSLDQLKALGSAWERSALSVIRQIMRVA